MIMAKKQVTEIAGRDELASSLAEGLNKKFKDFKAVYFLDNTEETPTDLTEWVSTGSSTLDLAIANRPNGGLPVGRIAEFTGLEAAGKSLIMAHLLANTQKKGGLAVYIDTENALSEEFLRAIGVDVANMLYIPLETIEDIFEAIENIIESIRKSSKDRLVTIVVDSVAAATTKVELEADYDKDGWATTKAILMSKAMRKITNMIGKQRIVLAFTNQLREKMGVMFGDKYTTSGGKALGFHASVRVRLQSVGKLKAKIGSKEIIVGVETEATVTKNRLGPPYKKAKFEIYFDSGINDLGSWFTLLKEYGVLSGTGAWYTLVREDTGEEIKFQSKDWIAKLEADQDLKNYAYDKMCSVMISKYRHTEQSSEIEVDSTDVIGFDE